MDLDRHRQKRSRLRSTDANNDLSQRDDVDEDESEQAKPKSQGRLSTTTTALRDISLQDKESETQVKTAHSVSNNPVNSLQHSIQPTPPASFLTHPASDQNGAPHSSAGFRAFLYDNNSGSRPTPPSFHSAIATSSTSSHQFTSTSSGRSASSARPEICPQPTTLPIHGGRNRQPSGRLIAGPSSKQVASDAKKAPPETDVSRYNTSFLPGYQPRLPINPHVSSTEAAHPSGKRSSRPQPIYVPASEEGKAINPFAYNAVQFPATPPPSYQETQKQILSPSAKRSGTELAAGVVANGEHPRQGHPFAGASFPYPSIYPANERRSKGEDATFPRSPPGYPPNHYTSPNRIPNAALIASRKRKRGWPALAPPAYIYTRTNNPNFNIFDGILLFPELCFALAANLPVNTLVSLYAISKDFHTIIDTRFTNVIRNQAFRKCPESYSVFSYRCYKNLCRDDPAPRIPHPHPAKQAAGEIRKVPSFRWLKMILFRDKACHEILTLMAEDGVPMPSGCKLALKKMWFLMDIPDNARRIGYMHIRKLVSDIDLYFMMCFIVKLDLRLNDPAATNRYHGLRKVLLSQRGLSPIWRALKRRSLLTKHEVLKMWVKTRYEPAPDEQGLPMFGIPTNAIGKMKMEYRGERATHDTGKPCTFLMRPDQLLMREIVRRDMIFSKHFLRCLLWGYVNIATLENYPPRRWDRKIKELEEEYDDDDECADPSNFGKDDLLDLGIKKPISMLVAPRGQDRRGNQGQTKEDAFLEECVKWYRDERQLHMDEEAG